MFGTLLRAAVMIVALPLVLWTLSYVLSPILDVIADHAAPESPHVEQLQATLEFLPLIVLLSIVIMVGAAAAYQRRAGAVR